MATKLLIIGFDGMGYDIARETMPQGQDLILKKLRVKIAKTGPSWTTFYTGLPADVHGVTDDWGRPEGGSNSYDDIKGHTFWSIIKKHGHSVFTDNLPATPSGFPFTSSKEKDIINYLVNPLYFAKDGKRYRSLGCKCCTSPVNSNASSLDEIIAELETTKTPERAGRSQDKEKEQVMRRLRALGYM